MSSFTSVNGSMDKTNYYPMAENIPFTRVIKDQPGDPFYVAPGTKHFTEESVLRVGAEKFADFIQTYGEKSVELRVTFEQATPCHRTISAVAITCIVYGYFTNNIGVSKAGNVLDQLFLAGGFVAVAFGVLDLIRTTHTFPIAMAKTASYIKDYLRRPVSSCDMKLTQDALRRIGEIHQYPQELYDVITLDKIQDPVTFLDRTGKDAMMMIFERASAIELVNKHLNHPISGRKLSYEDLVELPDLKRQIEDLSRDSSIKDPS